MDDEKLSKYTVDDLLKTHDEIETFLNKIGGNIMPKTKVQKTDESDYVPDDTVDHSAHEETGGDETTTPVEKQGEEFVEDEMQDTAPDEEMTAPSQDDAFSRLTEALNDMRAMMTAILEAVQPAAAPEMAPEMAPPGIEEKSGSGQGFSITIGKEIKKQLAEMGLTKSVKTTKPKVETEHPIEKNVKPFDLKKMKDMSWREVDELNKKAHGQSDRKFY